MNKRDTCFNGQFGYLCNGCKHDPDATDKYVPMSVGDMIRNMSDEELFDFLYDIAWKGEPYKISLEWIQSPVIK